MGPSTRTGNRGFTIIELMVVLALIVILASLAMVQYRRTIIYSKEAVLRDDLDRDGTGDVPHHPVRLFSLLVAGNEPVLITLRSPFVTLLDLAERVLPSITPETLVDASPSMRRFR